MPAEGLRSNVDPMTTYIVSTQGGRVLKREAFDYNDLIRDLYNNQHMPVKIWTQSEYDAEMEGLKQEIKEELKTA